MSPRAVRWIVIVVCVAGTAGMIVGSVADNNGAALTAGLVTAVAVLCLIVATAVTGPIGAPAGSGDDAPEALGAAVEAQVERLVASGTDEAALRSLVKDAVQLGQARAR